MIHFPSIGTTSAPRFLLHIYGGNGESQHIHGDDIDSLKSQAFATLLAAKDKDFCHTAEIYHAADLTAKNYPRPVWRASFDVETPERGHFYL